ncbi:unnamed protein product [Camellia sinensis]
MESSSKKVSVSLFLYTILMMMMMMICGVRAWTGEINGRVVCDLCGDSSIGPEDHVLQGAEVAVLCITKSGEVLNYQAFTNSKGVYTVAETMPESDRWDACLARPISSFHEHCTSLGEGSSGVKFGYNHPSVFEVFSDKSGPPSSPADVDEYWKTEIRAMKLIQSIFQGNEAYGTPAKGWSQSLRQLLLPSSFHVSDRILLYIAERTPGLTMISLSNTSKIAGTSFTMAITHWTHLKLLIIGPIDGGFSIDIIRQLGKHCNKLESLHIHVNSFTLDKDSATAIATNLPRLKSLSFLHCSIRKSGVKVVAKQCSKVSFVAIECCSLVEEIEPSLTRTRAPRCCDFEEWRSRKLEFRVTNDRRW